LFVGTAEQTGRFFALMRTCIIEDISGELPRIGRLNECRDKRSTTNFQKKKNI